MTDPYIALGVSKTASDQEIRSAYRRLVKQYHPDRNPDDPKAEERFKEIGKAYSLIGDKEKRAQFDRGTIDSEGQARGPFGAGGAGGAGFGGFQGGFGGEDLGDIFSGMFGGGLQPRRGQDVHGELYISFEEAALGTRREVDLGNGKYVAVNVSAGAEDGKTLRLKGKGHPGQVGLNGRQGPPGDVLLKMHVAASSYYKRDGRNLRVTQDIDLRTAVLGGKVHIKTPKGVVAVSVKPNSDSGTTLRLRGRGISETAKHPAGDLFATLRIVLGKENPNLTQFLREQEVKT